MSAYLRQTAIDQATDNHELAVRVRHEIDLLIASIQSEQINAYGSEMKAALAELERDLRVLRVQRVRQRVAVIAAAGVLAGEPLGKSEAA